MNAANVHLTVYLCVCVCAQLDSTVILFFIFIFNTACHNSARQKGRSNNGRIQIKLAVIVKCKGCLNLQTRRHMQRWVCKTCLQNALLLSHSFVLSFIVLAEQRYIFWCFSSHVWSMNVVNIARDPLILLFYVYPYKMLSTRPVSPRFNLIASHSLFFLLSLVLSFFWCVCSYASECAFFISRTFR